MELTSNQIATGQGLRVNSLGTPIELEFQIKYSQDHDLGTVEVIDITPIVSRDNLDIEITVANYSPSDTEIKLKINGSNEEIEETISINKFDFSKRITKTIHSFEEKLYTIEILTETAKYTQSINPIKPKQDILIEDKNREQPIVQKIDINKNDNNYHFDITLENPLVILMLVILLITITLVTAYYFSQKTRYI